MQGRCAEPGTPGFSPDHVSVGSPAVLVQLHHEGSLLWAPDLDIPCFDPVCHSLDGERRRSLLRMSLLSPGCVLGVTRTENDISPIFFLNL